MPDPRLNRRAFFRYGLGELLESLESVAAPLKRVAEELSSLEGPAEAPKPAWLRPPGALAEVSLAATCTRGGECVRACPAQCIKIDPANIKGGGLPYIEVDAMPCVVCTGLDCMRVCPSGALVQTAVVDIDMGTAEWRSTSCVRSKGENCTICIDKCPLGSAAIELAGNDIHVIADGCIGCGLCQYYCPTTPKSIVVIPKAAR